MAIQNEPSRISTPFADAGTKNVIPETMAQPSATAAASWQAGFPTVCSLPLSAGGIPPARNDFNGLFNQMTQTERFLQDGGIFSWSADTDYGANRLVLGSDGKLYWSAAQSGPNTGAGAVDPTTDSGAYWGQLPVTATEAAEAAYSSVAGGFVPWSSAENYAVSQIALGSDGLVYMAKAASGPGTTAGAKDPATDTSQTYWAPPQVPTMPVTDVSKSAISSEWVRNWYLNIASVGNYYVDAVNGDDSNDGTQQHPKKTLAGVKALLLSPFSTASEYTVYVKSGDYSSDIVSGIYGKRVSYVAESGGCTINEVYVDDASMSVILYGPWITTATTTAIQVSSGSVVLTDGCEISLSGAVNTPFYITSAGVLKTAYLSNVTINYDNVTGTANVTVTTNGLFAEYGTITWNGIFNGQRYQVTSNGTIFGIGGPNVIPGTSEGTVDSSGFYG